VSVTALVAALAAAVIAVEARPVPAVSLPRVTLIGDSVSAAIAYDRAAQKTLGNGASLELELAPCRRVGQTSCPHKDTTAPTVLQLVQARGRTLDGSTVIVAVGYNDFETLYAGNIEDALAAMRAAGVRNVLWLTLRAERQSYLAMNGMIRAAAAQHPEMTVVDWNLYSRNHPDWFQPDGLHLGWAGARALATLLHRTLVDLGIVKRAPLKVSVASVRGTAGKPLRARLLAKGGKAPYRWMRASGLVPRGLRLTAAGRLYGTPRVRGRFTFIVRVTDASRSTATRRIVVRVA
jgi:hypothetical protein